MSIRKQNGQALLLVLLGMAAVLTLVLSVASRSVTDVSITTQDEDSLRAFSAAEAGVEQMLVGGETTGSIGELGNYSGKKDLKGEGASSVHLTEGISAGESTTLWFVQHDESNNLYCDDVTNRCFSDSGVKLCWGNDSDKPAIEVTVYYDTTLQSLTTANYSNVRVARAVIDSDSSRAGLNHFASADPSGCNLTDASGITKIYPYAYNIDFGPTGMQIPYTCYSQQGCLLFARIKSIYNNSSINPIGSITTSLRGFPGQGEIYRVTGSVGSANRSVQVEQTYREQLSIFENAIVSYGNDATIKD